MPFDVKDILKQVEAGTAPEAGIPEWWRESWAEPDGFATALADAHAGRGAPPPKSRPGQQYDFFHDLVVRHVAQERPALRTFERLQGWQTLSYRALHEQAARRAGEWAEQGVKAGAKVCLLYGMGSELLISLMAGVKLGVCVSLLPPLGPRFVSRRLEALAPEHVAAEPHQLPLLKGFEKTLLRVRTGASPGFSSYSYKPADPVGLVFSPLADPSHVPVPLSADDAWRGALADGLITFGLGPGEQLAAPGFSLLQGLPAMLFATLLRGATFVHVELADLERNAAPLLEQPLRALGVSNALRELLTRTRVGALRNVSHWFRNPEEPLDAQAWRAWIKQAALGSTPCSSVLVDPALGGAVLLSPRWNGEPQTDVLPAPGRRWALRDANQSGQDSASDVGLYTPLPDKKRPPSHVVLARIRERYHYGGTLGPRRDGRVYPTAEVTAVLEGLPSLVGTSIVAVPTSGVASQPRFVLLGFTGARAPSASAEQEIRRRIEHQLGVEFLPDRVALFPLFPRRKKGAVDDAWCASQFFTGALHRKASDPSFQALVTIRGRLLESASRPGEDAGPAVK
ncbi:long-chain fatty acid--CoA ligase [Myxococcaceae bacterium JPH2]|nr:long-chain fatty acid--CoA ligase [Myxococcaceae bacterium JPH2]